jgi:hypothetical protein
LRDVECRSDEARTTRVENAAAAAEEERIGTVLSFAHVEKAAAIFTETAVALPSALARSRTPIVPPLG